MSTISVVISAWNEQYWIKRCLSSVRQLADEIILVDNSSTDDTAKVAKKYKAIVYTRPNNPMLNVNKNYGFEKATGDWILNLDADEEISDELANEIKLVIQKKQDSAGFWIPRKNIIFGKWIEHGIWWPDRHLRLFRREKGKFPCKHVHEYISVDGPTESLTTPFIHHNYDSISQFIRKMDSLYTENEVSNLIATTYQFAWFDAIRFPISDFVKIYFAQQGYKDGLHGLVLAMLQAFYSFIVFAKLWEKNTFVERPITLSAVNAELARSAREIRFWSLTSRIRQSRSPIARFLLKVQKKVTV